MLKNIKIVFMILLVTSILWGCSQSTENPPPPTTNDTLQGLTDIDTALIKEVDANHSFDDPFVALNPYENAPLSAVVIFSTQEETAVKVKVLGHEEPYDLKHQFEKSTEHILPIYGLYAGEENTIMLTLDDGSTKELKITTEKLDETYGTVQVNQSNMENRKKIEKGLTFVALSMKSPDGLTALAYDGSGDARWALKSDTAGGDIIRLKNGKLLVSTEESHSPPYYTTGIREIDLLGKTYKEYIIPGGYHHSAVELPSGNFLVAANDPNSDTLEDMVYEINCDTGAVERSFDLKDLLPQDDGASFSAKSDDWFHNNSVWYHEKSNSIILSGRNADAVISIDYETGELRWILGDPEGWHTVDENYFFNPVGEDFQWQYAQHAAMVTPEDHIFLFDNGPFRAKKTNEEDQLTGDENYSRGVIYKIQEDSMTVEQFWAFGKDRGPEWFSLYLGDVDYLTKGHYLINSGGQLYDGANKTHEVPLDQLLNPEIEKTSSIVEIKDDEVIFEIETDFNIYAVERMELYSSIKDFELKTPREILGKSD